MSDKAVSSLTAVPHSSLCMTSMPLRTLRDRALFFKLQYVWQSRVRPCSVRDRAASDCILYVTEQCPTCPVRLRVGSYSSLWQQSSVQLYFVSQSAVSKSTMLATEHCAILLCDQQSRVQLYSMCNRAMSKTALWVADQCPTLLCQNLSSAQLYSVSNRAAASYSIPHCKSGLTVFEI
jgi:hypothetical protein